MLYHNRREAEARYESLDEVNLHFLCFGSSDPSHDSSADVGSDTGGASGPSEVTAHMFDMICVYLSGMLLGYP